MNPLSIVTLFIAALFLDAPFSLPTSAQGQVPRAEHWVCHDPIQDDIEALRRIIENFSEDQDDPEIDALPPKQEEQPPVRLRHTFTTTPDAARVSMDTTDYTATFTIQGHIRIWNFGPTKHHYFLITPSGVGSYYDLTGFDIDRYGHLPRIRTTQPTHKYTCKKETP